MLLIVFFSIYRRTDGGEGEKKHFFGDRNLRSLKVGGNEMSLGLEKKGHTKPTIFKKEKDCYGPLEANEKSEKWSTTPTPVKCARPPSLFRISLPESVERIPHRCGSVALTCIRMTWRAFQTDNKALHTVSASVGLGRGTKMCISNKFPGDADSAGPGATL